MSVSETIPVWSQGDRLRKAREVTGLSVQDFADRIGVSDQTVRNAERGSHAVRKITINAWSLATGVPIAWLNGEPCDYREGVVTPLFRAVAA